MECDQLIFFCEFGFKTVKIYGQGLPVAQIVRCSIQNLQALHQQNQDRFTSIQLLETDIQVFWARILA